MSNDLAKQIRSDLEQAEKNAALTASEVYQIARNTVVRATEGLTESSKDVRKLSSDALRAAVQTLVEGGEASRDKIAAATSGVCDGITQVERNLIERLEDALHEHSIRVQDERAALAKTARESLDSAREVANDYSGQVREDIEAAVADAKLRMMELLGITRQAVHEAVKTAVGNGTEVDETVRVIARDATVRAVDEMKFTADRARKVSEAVLSAAVAAAEEAGGSIRETAYGAAEGVREGLTEVVERTSKSLAGASKQAGEFTATELKRAKEDLETIGDLFVETLRKVADRSGTVASEVLSELAEDARKAGSGLREATAKAAEDALVALKKRGQEARDAGERASHVVASEAQELGDRMLAVAKGAAVGMWEGAKKALGEDDKRKAS
jgi:Family of unknown function (DUF6781)